MICQIESVSRGENIAVCQQMTERQDISLILTAGKNGLENKRNQACWKVTRVFQKQD